MRIARGGDGHTGDVGRIVWHDLMTNDLAGAMRFYAELFGWEYRIEHAAECAWTGEEADYPLGSGPADAPVLGRCAVLADPAGAQFGLIVARDGWVEVPNV